jgi:uncharacterized 2Fe-2S/4Fe-4S cluster protein (DUF4445 family)
LNTIKVRIRPSGLEIAIDPALPLLENLRKEGLFVESICGGEGTCGKCRVRFIKGAPPPSESEERHLSRKQIEEGWRLACQVSVGGEAEVFVPPASSETTGRVLAKGRSAEVEIDPEARKVFLELQRQTLERPIGDAELILEQPGMGELSIGLSTVRELPRLLREADYKVTVTVTGGEIAKIEPGDTTSKHFGLAIDLGTTTLVVSLIDLHSGEERAVVGGYNPQRRFGEDVISRIQHCREKPYVLDRMSEVLTEHLCELINDACEEAGIRRSDVSEAVVVGNPTMQHIFLEIDPSYIGEMPYAPAICRKVRFNPFVESVMDIGAYPIQIPPNLSGFIGSDVVGGIISQGLLESDEIQLLIDLGTNAEIVLGNRERLLVSNAAAGPAFEGAKIECGTSGLEGAIDRIWFDEEDIRFSVIADIIPSGICGSGLVDAVACLLDLGILDRSGKMADPEKLPRKLSARIRKRLEKEKKSGKFWFNDEIYLSQKDIRHVQAAKAAVAAGIDILAKKMGIQVKDIARVMIAGAFGSYVSPASAMRIGLLPELPLDRMISVGNSALEGAKVYLLSKRARQQADRIRDIVEVHELSAEEEFKDVFVSGMPFP